MNRTVFFAVLLLLIPGCLEDVEMIGTDSREISFDTNSTYSNVTMNIYLGESLEDSTANYSITIRINHTAAPIHADNIVKHVEAGNYDMSTFHRIIDDFMIQGGDFENHDGSGGYAADWYGYCDGQSATNSASCGQTDWTIPDEADNGLKHYPCVISMAKTSSPNTGGSQFFLTPDDINQHTWLDGVHTVFGDIIEGCEHVTTISQVSTGQGDKPITPVVIYSATVN
jgi:cyclophilin family peptidyl-prolyl cis-trans isomerase|tara:strand:+ start:7169 stop:7849 length:681 start_codon:yes stop_codon:yes gene_type:complete